MAGIQARRERKRRQKIYRALGWVLVYVFELLMALGAASLVAAIALPAAYKDRGYFGIGGEWLLILLVFCLAYKKIHNRICNRIFEEEV